MFKLVRLTLRFSSFQVAGVGQFARIKRGLGSKAGPDCIDYARLNMVIRSWNSIVAIAIFLCCSGGFVVNWTASAQDDPPAKPQAPDKSTSDEAPANLDRIRQLISHLDSDELAQRDEAESELVKLGPDVLKYLPSITPKTSGELKVRLQRIRKDLESVSIESQFDGTKVTLQGSMTLPEIFEQMKVQTGNSVRLQNDELATGEMQVDWKDTPFWSAIDDIIIEKSLRLIPFATTESQLVLGSANESEMPSPFFDGPFRIDVTGVESQRTFGTQLDGFTRVSYTFSWEPRLDPVFMQIPMSSVVAKTADGAELRAANPNASPEVRLNIGGATTQIEVQLQRIGRQHEELESIGGQLVISVPSGVHQYEFKKFVTGKKQTQRFGDVNVTLEGAHKNGRVYEIRLFVQFGDPQGALDSFRGWILSNRAFILDANDKVLENVGFQTYGASDKGVGVSYMFQLNADPDSYRLIYESPSSIKRQTINYQLKNVPLP